MQERFTHLVTPYECIPASPRRRSVYSSRRFPIQPRPAPASQRLDTIGVVHVPRSGVCAGAVSRHAAVKRLPSGQAHPN